VIMLDGDEAGRKSSMTVGRKLDGKFRVFVAYPPEGRDPKNLNYQETKRCMREMRRLKDLRK